MIIKFKNWIIKLAIKGLVKHEKDVCEALYEVIENLEIKYHVKKTIQKK